LHAATNALAQLKDSVGQIPEGQDFPRPALESVKEAENLAGILGYSHILVYRWRGGTLEGSFQFQTKDEPEKIELEVAKRARLFFDKDRTFDPRAVSGVIMIAGKGRKDFITDYLVEIQINVQMASKGEQAQKGPLGTITSRGTSYTLTGSIGAAKAGINYPPAPARSYTATALEISFGSGDATKKDYQPTKYRFCELKVITEGGK
jgi:hypothetical protein